MGKSEFSEKLYENLVNTELLKKTGYDIYIPSQKREEKTGIDVLFQSGKRKVLYLQYKIVEEYDRVPSYFKSTKAFKFTIYKSKRNGYSQHNSLVKKVKRGLNCGYFVPCFTTYDDLYKFFHTNKLIDNSRLLQPTISLVAKKGIGHFIDFDSSTSFQHSKNGDELPIFELTRMIQSAKKIDLNELIRKICGNNLNDDYQKIDDELRRDKAFLLLI